jgi:two-component system OmpR family response regulator
LASACRIPRILVVDDDPAILELLTARLLLADYEVSSARDGAQALSAIAEAKPSAMVLDINMPVMDGFGVLKRLKAQGLLATLPTMVLTARHQKDDVVEAIKLGARDYMAKPFDDQIFLLRISRLLRTAKPLTLSPDGL